MKAIINHLSVFVVFLVLAFASQTFAEELTVTNPKNDPKVNEPKSLETGDKREASTGADGDCPACQKKYLENKATRDQAQLPEIGDKDNKSKPTNNSGAGDTKQ